MWVGMLLGKGLSVVSGTITLDTDGTRNGYNSGGAVYGSISPNIVDGRDIAALFDNPGLNTSTFTLKGFSSDPGQNFLFSLKVGAILKPSSTVLIYTYNATAPGSASWGWTAFGMAAGGSTNFTIILQ